MPVCEMELQKAETVPPKQPLRVCFVCTGNTCRSPMAAAVANVLAREQGKEPTLVAVSAGLYAVEGEPISPCAAKALARAGFLPQGGAEAVAHRAHTLTDADVTAADLLVGISGGHCMELLLRYPQAATRITAMPEPIADPYGGDEETYVACLAEIVKGVRRLLFSADGEGGAE